MRFLEGFIIMVFIYPWNAHIITDIIIDDNSKKSTLIIKKQ
jgi:hypothetical protein